MLSAAESSWFQCENPSLSSFSPAIYRASAERPSKSRLRAAGTMMDHGLQERWLRQTTGRSLRTYWSICTANGRLGRGDAHLHGAARPLPHRMGHLQSIGRQVSLHARQVQKALVYGIDLQGGREGGQHLHDPPGQIALQMPAPVMASPFTRTKKVAAGCLTKCSFISSGASGWSSAGDGKPEAMREVQSGGSSHDHGNVVTNW